MTEAAPTQESPLPNLVVGTDGSILQTVVFLNGFKLGRCTRVNIFGDVSNEPTTRLKLMGAPTMEKATMTLEEIIRQHPFVIAVGPHVFDVHIYLEGDVIGRIQEMSFEASVLWGVSMLLHISDVENFMVRKLQSYSWIKVSESKLNVDITHGRHQLG